MSRRGATRAMGTLAAALAHEVKNPLSGVRGAAQLLEPGLDEAGRNLTRLICEEVDRIVALVDRMEMFADERPLDRGPVNIHRVLDHVRQLAEAGFARGRRFVCDYDPSLPPVLGNRDLLVQLFLNLVKNAAEATAGGRRRHHALDPLSAGPARCRSPTAAGRYLPLMVAVQDNGSGIPEAMRHACSIPSVRQAGRQGPRPGAGGQDRRRSWRVDRVRQRAAPHAVPRAAAHGRRKRGKHERRDNPGRR